MHASVNVLCPRQTLIRPLVHLCSTYCAITVTYVNGVVALIDTHDVKFVFSFSDSYFQMRQCANGFIVQIKSFL